MRILTIGNFGRGWDGSICDEEHIAKALEELGHEVIRVQRGTWNNNNGEADFTLIAQWDQYQEELIVNLPKPIVYWAFDYQEDNQEWHQFLVNNSDLYLSKRIADSKYPNWRWLSQDFAPDFLHSWDKNPAKDIDVLFTGSYLPWAEERNLTIRAVASKFNLVIHSVNPWPDEWNLDVRPPIMDHGLPELYARAKVILSIDHTLEAGYWSDRNAQIICCKRRPLFRYVPLSESRFHNDVDYFYSTQDCLEKIEQILEQNPRIERVAFDKSDYTVTGRVRDLLTIVEDIL